jgi:signal transduction histidine kinase
MNAIMPSLDHRNPDEPQPGDPRPARPEAALDDLAALAAHVCQAPLAFIALAHGAQYWCKSAVGLPADEFARDPALASFTLGRRDMLVVPDMGRDARFALHRLVAGRPHVRFYAGVPLISPDGHRLGCMCVVDLQPHDLTAAQTDALGTVAAQATAQLLLQRITQERDQLRLELRELGHELDGHVASRMAELQRANDDLRAFCYSVAHELGGPLRAIAAFSQLLGNDTESKLSSEGARYVEFISQGARHMKQLTEDLLKFFRLSQQPLRKQPVATPLLVQEIIEELRREHPHRAVVFRVGHLPGCEADPSLLRQVFLNLLSNALKFTRPRDPAVIEVGWCDSDDGPAYFVRDNGVGFDPQFAAKLFAPFQRLHSHDQFEGSGVGLSLVHRIIERHGGRIWAEARVNEGATFYFTLPE